MQTRSKVVELSGLKFQIRRLPPEVGSFIFMRMLGVSMRSAAAEAEAQLAQPAPPQDESTEPAEDKPVVTGEMKVRALSFSVFAGGMKFEDFKFIQNGCMRVVSVVEERSGVDFPMPIVSDAGVWTPSGEDVSVDIGLVMRLTTEVLVFCFADFFDGGGLGL